MVVFALLSCTAMAQYIDLGLPSGTKWADTSEEGFYTYNAAVTTFGKQLPTHQQYQELMLCDWVFVDGEWRAIGLNGKYITFEMAGIRNCNEKTEVVGEGKQGSFWSATLDGKLSYSILLLSRFVTVVAGDTCYSKKVRLVE